MPKPSAQKAFTGLHLNLLYPQGTDRKLYLKYLRWLVTYGRFIIILVEIVVLTAFGMRFSYDAQLGDLKTDIAKQTQVLESYIIDEPRIIQAQKKLDFIKKSYESTPPWQKIFSELAIEMPQTVKLTNATVDQDPASATPKIQFKIAAQTSSINDLGFFLKNLRDNKAFKEVTLQNINIEQGQIVFNITGGIVQ